MLTTGGQAQTIDCILSLSVMAKQQGWLTKVSRPSANFRCLVQIETGIKAKSFFLSPDIFEVRSLSRTAGYHLPLPAALVQFCSVLVKSGRFYGECIVSQRTCWISRSRDQRQSIVSEAMDTSTRSIVTPQVKWRSTIAWLNYCVIVLLLWTTNAYAGNIHELQFLFCHFFKVYLVS